MKDIKSIISAKVKEGAKTFKGLTIENISPYGEPKKGRQGYILTFNKAVRAMVRAEDVDTDALEAAVAEAEALVAEADANVEATKSGTADEKKAAKDAKAEADAKLAEAKAALAAVEDAEYVKGERDFIFVSNYELLGVIKHNPQLRFLYRMAQADETLLEDIYIGSTISVLAEDVVSGEEYVNPFSFDDTSTVVANDSVYHSIYNLVPGDEAQETIEDCRAIKRDLRKDLLKEAMKVGNKARKTVVVDDEDSED